MCMDGYIPDTLLAFILYDLGPVPDFSDSSLLHQYHQNSNSNL